MIALWIILSILLFIMLLLCFSITVYVKITDEVSIFVGAFGYKYAISFEEKSDKDKQKAKKAKKAKKSKKLESAKEKVTEKKANDKSLSQTLEFAITLIKSIVPSSVKMLSHIRINKIKLFMTVACEDADKTALAYGGVNASIYTLLGVLDSTFKTEIISVDIIPDFVTGEAKYDISFKVKLRFIHIILGLIGIVFKIIVNTIKNHKNHKLKKLNKVS